MGRSSEIPGKLKLNQVNKIADKNFCFQKFAAVLLTVDVHDVI